MEHADIFIIDAITVYAKLSSGKLSRFEYKMSIHGKYFVVEGFLHSNIQNRVRGRALGNQACRFRVVNHQSIQY